MDLLLLDPPTETLDALATLSDSNDPATLTTLMAALRHQQEAIACAAARELGTRGERAAIPRLIKSIGPYPVDYDVPITVRAASASALARMGNPAGVPLILTILTEGTELEAARTRLPWTETTRMAFVQELALEGLVALAGTDFGFSPDGSVPDKTAAAMHATKWWEQNRMRLWMASELPETPGLVTRTRMLVAHLRSYQLRQIDGAIYTLRQLGPDVTPYLVEGLRSQDDYVRLHVLDVMTDLAKVVDRKTCGRLAVLATGPLLQDPSPVIAARAAQVCGAAQVADPLINALERRDEAEVRLAVIDALAATRLSSALDTLTEWASAPEARDALPGQRVALEAALLALDASHSSSAFLEMLASENDAVSYPAVERLITMTGSDHGLDPSRPMAEREQALKRAEAALATR
jgi:HEAT repeat protein